MACSHSVQLIFADLEGGWSRMIDQTVLLNGLEISPACDSARLH